MTYVTDVKESNFFKTFGFLGLWLEGYRWSFKSYSRLYQELYNPKGNIV